MITEDFPFGEEVLVFKVFGKIFLLTNVVDFPLKLNLKCNPEHAIELRERYDAVRPGYHMNKRLWNTVTVDQDVGEKLLFELIDHSYDEIVKTLPLKIQRKIISPPLLPKKKTAREH